VSGSDIEASIRAQLTAPGAPFEMGVEDVLGVPMRVFKERARSLRDLLVASQQHGDAEYLVDGSERISFEEHLARVASVARVLRDAYGIRKGDRVAIFAANSAEWAVAFWATVSLGGIVSAMNGWWTADEFSHAWELSEPQLLIGDTRRLARVKADTLGAPVIGIERDFGPMLDWVFRDDPLPRNPTGKVLKTALLGDEIPRFTDDDYSAAEREERA
jgi:hypothetical protein